MVIATPSLLYYLLPSVVQCRIPKLRSLRQIATLYGRSATHTRTLSDASDGSVTPPPSYRTSARSSICESDDEYSVISQSERLGTSTSSRSATPTCHDETERGVRWKYARQGHTLLSLSTQEAGSLSQNPQFSRKLYIDSLQYLLNGLPSELTAQEELSLRASLPAALVSGPSCEDQLIVRSAGKLGHVDKPKPALEPSILHQAVANITLYALLIFSFLLPYVKLLLQQAYHYDRRHKISDRLFAQGVMTADVMGKQTLLLAHNICAMNGGKVGEAVRDMGMWWIQGISGGVYDGLGEGMHVLELKTSVSRN